MQKFGIDVNKKPIELSEGMKVKFSLAAALSHGAELLILDEPTSGLDPVSREELLEIFMALSKEGTTILFSTHIITDIEKAPTTSFISKKGKSLQIAASRILRRDIKSSKSAISNSAMTVSSAPAPQRTDTLPLLRPSSRAGLRMYRMPDARTL